jgi:hypothetical protein
MKCNNYIEKLFLNTKIRVLTLGNNFSVYIIAFHFSMLKAFYPIEIKIVTLKLAFFIKFFKTLSLF